MAKATIKAQGIVSDISPYDLPNEVWSGGSNVRFDDIKTLKSLGHSQVFGTPTEAPYHLLPWTTPTNSFWVAGCDGNVYRTVGNGTYTDISKVGGYTAGATSWTGGVTGGVLIVNNGVDVPQFIGPSGSQLADLTNWLANTKAAVIRPFKNYLIALNTTESSTEYPFRVRWSHPADPGAVPSSWDATDNTKDAGINDLSQTDGWVVDCLPLKDTNIIYKEDSVWGMSHIGGNFVFRFYEIFNDAGILSDRCVKGFEGKHFVLGSSDVYVHDGVGRQSVIDKKMRDWLFNRIDSTYYSNCFVTANYAKTEMWVCFPETGSTTGHCDKALIWNWKDNTWSVRVLPNVRHIGWGVVNDSAAPVSWDGTGGHWDGSTAVWGSRTYNPTDTKLLMAGTADAKIYLADDTNQFAGSNYDSYVERTGVHLGTPDVKSVSAVYPRIDGTGAVNVYVGAEMVPNAGVAWEGPYAFTPGTDKKIDCRVTGRYLAVKFQSNSNASWELDSYDIEYTQAGQR